MWVFQQPTKLMVLKHSTESQEYLSSLINISSLLGECCDDQENIINLLTMLLQIIWNFQMNRNESFYFRTEVRKQKWCVPTSSVPLPKIPLLPAHSDRLAFPPAVSIRAESFPELHPGRVASWPLQSCAAAGDALSMELWLLWATCPFPGSTPPTSSEAFAPFPALPSMLHPWYSVLFACNMRL